MLQIKHLTLAHRKDLRVISPLSGPEIRALLRAFPRAIISVSHDRNYIEEVCDRVYRLIKNGLRLERQD